MSEWKKAGEAPSTWDPSKDENGALLLEPIAGKSTLEGILVERKDNIGQYNSSVVVIETEEGIKKSVWLDKVLAERFENIKIGEEVKIEFKGRKKLKAAEKKHPSALDKKTDYYKIWDVYSREPEGGVRNEPAQQAQVSNSVAPSGDDDSDGLPF